MDELHQALQDNFGHSEFRPYQEAIIRQVLEGVDTLGVLPTGAGKSLCYQLPALLLPKPTLVISPLIALMQDQFDGLPPAVYPQATLINSSVSGEELQQRLTGIANGTYRLIYAAPERLRQQSFLDLMRFVGLSLVVVDEAHCVSVWGHDFRPDYLFIRKALEALSEGAEEPPAIMALTATATPEMQAEIAAQLGRDLVPLTASTFRPNLRLEAIACTNADEKMEQLKQACKETPGAAVIYARSRENCEKLAAYLNRQGVRAAFYHAGLDRETRKQTQEDFMLGRVRAIVATVAFGMGVDKSNVRLVAHFSLTESLESYTQEAGRAGRDGKPSRCILLYAPSDKANLSRWQHQNDVKIETVRDTYRAVKARIGRGSGVISPDMLMADVFGAAAEEQGNDTRLRVSLSMLERVGLLNRQPDAGRGLNLAMCPAPPEARAELDSVLILRRQQGETRLQEMLNYCETNQCRHALIARHFGHELEKCGDACDVCLGTVRRSAKSKVAAPTAAEVADIGRVLLEILQGLPFPLGRTGLAKVAAGAADSSVQKDRCPQFGALAGFSLNSLRGHIDTLTQAGFTALQERNEYQLLALTEAGREALEESNDILPNPNQNAKAPRQAAYASRSNGGAAAPIAPTDDEEDRFEQLRAWRRIEAERAKVPPYVVFNDATLRAIAGAAPETLRALEKISGIGPRKIELYGEAILSLLRGGETTVAENATE